MTPFPTLIGQAVLRVAGVAEAGSPPPAIDTRPNEDARFFAGGDHMTMLDNHVLSKMFGN